MSRLFLDCEWANMGNVLELVSLGLVPREDARTFYAEVDPLPDDPPLFVADTVNPLLGRGDTAAAGQADAMKQAIQRVEGPEGPRVE